MDAVAVRPEKPIEREERPAMETRQDVFRKTRIRGFGFVFFLICAAMALGCTPTPVEYPPPDKTAWVPDGCRTVPSDDEILGLPAEHFKGLHADTLNSDEVAIALAPVYEFEWTAEPLMYIAEGPVFDNQGNIYFSPLFPGEPVILVSLEPEAGARRWAIAGTTLYGGGGPLVLEDPANPGEQIVYQSVYDRAVAVRTDGTLVWDVPTGLPVPPAPSVSVNLGSYHCFGLNYHPQADALVGVMGDGHVVVLDRASGDHLLATPFVVPGSPSPLPPPSALPEGIIEKANEAVRPLVPAIPPEANTFALLGAVLLGFDSKVANYFAIDPHTGRMFVAATALDDEDGTVDGISELGALYGLEMVAAGGGLYTIQELYHTNFVGGSASSPALKADGTRVYLGDNLGNLIAVDTSNGNKIWEINVGSQIYGSVAVASDNDEIYTSNAEAVTKVRDDGATATQVWRSLLAGYDPGIGQELFNLNLATVGANGIFVQSGAGAKIGTTALPLALGVGQVDRETGQMRYFADGREETVSAVSVGPDGAVYFGHSPFRRAAAWALFEFLSPPPVTGGVGKYKARRIDLLIRDAACAASARALNAFNHAGACPDSEAADIRQIQALIDQSRRSSAQAIADGDLSAGDWTTLDGYLTLAEASLAPGTLDVAAGHLQQACDFF
jgi:outer membrane protein assembly factor BamB